MDLITVIRETDDLLVINKPAGLVSHPTKGDAYSSLISRVRLYLNASEAHLINRLDRETSGVVLVAKAASAAAELRRIWERREVRKEYLAIVHGRVCEPAFVIEAPLGKDLQSEVVIKDSVRIDGASASTEVRVEQAFVREEGEFTLVRVVPVTGRKHQIRIHLAHAGYPVVGDKLYGGDEQLYLDFVNRRLTDEQRRRLLLPYQALHAERLEFAWRGQTLAFHAEPEPWFGEFISRGTAL